MHVGAVVFDLDGTLVDTEAAWLAAEAELVVAAGHRFGPVDIAACRGGSIETVTTYLLDRLGLPPARRAAVAADLAARVAAHQPARPIPMPGALDLLRLLGGRVPLGIVTNSGRKELDRALDGIGLADLFPVTVSADDVEWPKPHPDGYLQAFAALGADPRTCVVIEDSAPGAEAARAAGAVLVTVPADRRRGPRGDLTLSSLADPVITVWAAAARRVPERAGVA